jgi:hypothetical protein
MPPIQVPLDFKELFQDALELLANNQVGNQSVFLSLLVAFPPII